LICANDAYALAVVRAATRLGVLIPCELSVVGFGNADYGASITPPLCTVHVPAWEMGRQAVRQLLIRIQSSLPTKNGGCHVRMMPELIVRGSTAAPECSTQH